MNAPLPPDLRARVLAAARAEPSPTRSVTRQRAAIALALGYGVAVALVVASGLETTMRPMSLIVTTAIGWMLVAIACAVASLRRGASMLGMPGEMLRAFAIATAPLLFTWGLAWAHVFGAPPIHPTMAGHIRCGITTLVLSLGPFFALAFVRRGSDPVHPAATGAVLGAAAGAWGSVMIDLHCPAATASHLAFAHVMPSILLAVLGAVFGKRWFGVTARDD